MPRVAGFRTWVDICASSCAWCCIDFECRSSRDREHHECTPQNPPCSTGPRRTLCTKSDRQMEFKYTQNHVLMEHSQSPFNHPLKHAHPIHCDVNTPGTQSPSRISQSEGCWWLLCNSDSSSCTQRLLSAMGSNLDLKSTQDNYEPPILHTGLSKLLWVTIRGWLDVHSRPGLSSI